MALGCFDPDVRVTDQEHAALDRASPQSGRSRGLGRPSLAFQTLSPGKYLEFSADGFLDRNDGSRLEYES